MTAAVDVNLDGQVDIVVADGGFSRVVWYENVGGIGDRAFVLPGSEHIAATSLQQPIGIDVGDIGAYSSFRSAFAACTWTTLHGACLRVWTHFHWRLL